MSHVDYKLKEGEYVLVNFKDVLKRFKDRERAYREFIHKPIHVGNGILDLIKEPEPIEFKVEDLYESWSPYMWPVLDALLKDRKDLQDRIEKYKKSRVA